MARFWVIGVAVEAPQLRPGLEQTTGAGEPWVQLRVVSSMHRVVAESAARNTVMARNPISRVRRAAGGGYKVLMVQAAVGRRMTGIKSSGSFVAGYRL
jgi:hypothetical protein